MVEIWTWGSTDTSTDTSNDSSTDTSKTPRTKVHAHASRVHVHAHEPKMADDLIRFFDRVADELTPWHNVK